jgi:hypothetical protein
MVENGVKATKAPTQNLQTPSKHLHIPQEKKKFDEVGAPPKAAASVVVALALHTPAADRLAARNPASESIDQDKIDRAGRDRHT